MVHNLLELINKLSEWIYFKVRKAEQDKLEGRGELNTEQLCERFLFFWSFKELHIVL
jgi:hypothetical protein